MIGKVFEVRGRFKGVTTVVIDIPSELYTDNLAPREEVEVIKVKRQKI